MMRRFWIAGIGGALFLTAIACGGGEGAHATPSEPAPVSAPAADAPDPGHAPRADGGASRAPRLDPFALCPSAAPNAGAFDVVGDGDGTSAAGVVSLRRRGDARATFLVHGSPFESLGGAPQAPYDADYVVTARIAGQEAALVARAGDDGTGYALRARGGKLEILAIGATDKTLASGDARLDSEEIVLRLRARDVDGRLELAGKAWTPNGSEPSAWAVTWNADVAGGARPGRIGVTIGPGGAPAAQIAYVHVDYASPNGLDPKDLSPLASCRATFPSQPPAPDGMHDDAADAKNAAEAAQLLAGGLADRPARVVAVSAGTNNDMDAKGASPGCDTLSDAFAKAHAGDRCISSRYEALDIAWSALQTAGTPDEESADPARTQWLIWGFGDSTKDALLWYHPTGARDPAYAIPIVGLGGANAALHGPDGAPKDGVIPLVSTFAYTYQHAKGDAAGFQGALVELAARGTFPGPSGAVPLAKDHLFVVSHSWGAAYTTTMLLRDELPGYHLDFAITAALPKIAVDLSSLLPCAGTILKDGLEGCFSGVNDVAPKLDVPQGIAVAPGGVVVYRVDRPDDPVANAKDAKSSLVALNAVIGSGTLSGHDYVLYEPSRATNACTLSGTNVKYSDGTPTAYAGVYGVDAFFLECAVDGAALDARCDGVQKQDGVFCKSLNGSLLCSGRPSGCQ
jgi:hypothetical protein